MQTDTQHLDLIATINAFCVAKGLSKSAFGKQAVGDPSFCFDIEAGREPRRKTIQRVRKFITEGAAQ